jgi:hypothetical protein
MRSLFVLLLLIVALSCSAGCVQDTSSAGAGTAGPGMQALTPAATPASPSPVLPGSGDNSPAGVINRYYASLDSGNYAAAADTLLPDLRPGADAAGAKQRFVTLYTSLYGQNGEKIRIENLSVRIIQQVTGCDIHRAGLSEICSSNHFDPVWEMQVSHDEEEVLDSGPVQNHYDEPVYAARYNGTWYLIL